MRVGIVGAGVAGLGSGRLLSRSGHQVVVFEADDRVGGRVETRRIGEFVFDTGASSIAPRGRSLEKVMFEELDASDLCRVELPVFTHTSLRVSSGDSLKSRIERFAYCSGNQRLPELLAEGLDVRLSTEVEHLELIGEHAFRINGQDFDAAILALPIPEAKEILASIGEARPLANARYRSCISVLLGFDRPLPDPKYHALLDPEQRHPLTWLSVESAKCQGRAPEGSTALVAQLGPEFSALHFGSDEELIYAATLEFVERLFGTEWTQPVVRGIRRWAYSQPETTALFDRANTGTPNLIIAGDGVVGGRVEYAYESGVLAADVLSSLRSTK